MMIIEKSRTMNLYFNKAIIVFFFISCSSVLHGQVSAQEKPKTLGITAFATIGSFRGTSLPASATMLQPFFAGAEFVRPNLLSLSKNVFVSAGVGLQSITAATNISFKSESGQTQFSPLDPVVRFNRLSVSQVYVPVSIGYILFPHPKGDIAVQGGMVPGYFFSFNNRLVTDNSQTTVNVPPQNPWQMAVRFEFGSHAWPRQVSTIQWAMGVNYQLTNFLPDTRSFRPMHFYFKIGVNF